MARLFPFEYICIPMILCAAGTSPAGGPDFVTDSAPENLARGNTGFAADLYLRLSEEEDGNLFFSPYSISSALAMTYAGARGDTREQMSDVLHFNLEDSMLHSAFASLELEIEWDSHTGTGLILRSVSALWGQEGYPFLQEYSDLLQSYYGAGIRQADFSSEPEEYRDRINEFVSENTGGRIPELIPCGVITTATRLVLSNAIYFMSDWKVQFDPMATAPRGFTLLDGSRVEVPTMTASEHFRTAAGDGWKAVELPYSGETAFMLVIVPDSGRFGEIEARMSTGFIEEVRGCLRDENLMLRMPGFQTTSALMLEETLESMGMTDAFGPGADFSGMDGAGWLYISSVVHQATITVDEQGTEASAATAVVMVKLNGESVTYFSVDRPFIHLIIHGGTGSLLFMGRMLDPRE
ncbi:MAG: hypothetical protein AVO35_10995 [Candidatus Aegiribacteria sp. MLS_C]|nr:MAG: hypothetical protein AVO35_10995 [Candidatus Aegiribacteria sp. MLS_C]